MPTLTNVNKATVLILDPNASALTLASNPVFKYCVAACERHQCYYETVHVDDLSTDQKAFSWDLILVPAITNVSANYTAFDTAIGTFTDTTIPVSVCMAELPATDGTRQAITGATAQAGSVSTRTYDTFGGWQGRGLTEMQVYSQPPTTLHANATAIWSDGTNNTAWSYDVQSHPCFWQAGYTNSNGNASVPKPSWCFQWMCDQQSTAAKNAAVRKKVRPSYSQFWIDGYDLDADQTTFAAGDYDTLYNAFVAAGVTEIWQAAVGGTTHSPGLKNTAVAAWFAARNENQGGLFRACNHDTDFVDNTGGSGPACTTDGEAHDNFANALTQYQTTCDLLTGQGLKIGTDGYGAGYPIVQNANDMNNPAAKFCADYGFYPVLEESETYPNGTGAAVPTVKVKRKQSNLWNGARTLIRSKVFDTSWATANTYSITYNASITKMYIYSGGFYVHAATVDDMVDNFIDTFLTEFVGCPHVFKLGPWEEALPAIEKGMVGNFDI